MTEQYKKAQYFLVKYQALSNAAEMIRSHGEEGFSTKSKSFALDSRFVGAVGK